MPFHQRLRQLLDENEITQKKLAADLHIAASTVGSYVQGVREPDFSILLRMADYFHVSADYLLDHREESAGPGTGNCCASSTPSPMRSKRCI